MCLHSCILHTCTVPGSTTTTSTPSIEAYKLENNAAIPSRVVQNQKVNSCDGDERWWMRERKSLNRLCCCTHTYPDSNKDTESHTRFHQSIFTVTGTIHETGISKEQPILNTTILYDGNQYRKWEMRFSKFSFSKLTLNRAIAVHTSATPAKFILHGKDANWIYSGVGE